MGTHICQRKANVGHPPPAGLNQRAARRGRRTRVEILESRAETTGRSDVCMFGVLFSILVGVGILSICGEIVMRIRLTKLELPSEKLLWLRRGGDEVADTYHLNYAHTSASPEVPIDLRPSSVLLVLVLMLR